MSPAWHGGLRGAGAAAAAVVAGLALSSCGGSSSALGHAACLDVSRSLAAYAQAGRSGPIEARAERARALEELRSALPLAARAGSDGGQWQALGATLSESSRVPESDLVTALQAQCATTLSGGG